MAIINNPTTVFSGDGVQPTLFSPYINKVNNEVTFGNSPSNGDFLVTITATIDGVAVTSPVTITSELNGKTLIVTARASNFNDAVSTLVLEYSQLPESRFIGKFLSASSGYDYLAFGFRSLSGVRQIYKGAYLDVAYRGTSLVAVAGRTVDTSIPLVLQATADGTCSGHIDITHFYTTANTSVALTETTLMETGLLNGSMRLIDVSTNNEAWGYNYSNAYYGYNNNDAFSFTATANHIYYLVFEGTFSS